MASWEKLVFGSLAFAVFWVTVVFPSLPVLPIGLTSGAILSSVLMVVFQVVTPTEAYASIDLSILGLLFGTMVVSAYLERADAYKYLGKLLVWKSQGPKDLLIRVCLVSGLTSAFFTNDTTCTVLTGFVLRLAREHRLPPQPFLLALACSANIGSAATPIGNPQNLVIATKGGISFATFLLDILPSTMVGLLLNTGLLLCAYWKDLASPPDQVDDQGSINGVPNYLESPLIEDGLPLTSSTSTDHPNVVLVSPEASSSSIAFPKWRGLMWKSSVYLVTVGMLVALLCGLNMSWTAITAAFTLVVIDFKDAHPCLQKVSYSLLVFFCGMFMTMDGFEATGIPGKLWTFLEPYSQIDKASGIAVLSIVILVLSNMISNVPTVLLLGTRMAASAAAISSTYETKSWIILAWVSTVAGNLTLIGSAANMIVAEQARRVPHVGHDLSFWSHLIFGFPSTILVTVVGLLFIVG